MSGLSLFRTAIALAFLALFASCAEMETPSTATAPVAPTAPPGYWHGDGISGEPKIVVSISEQRAYFYKGKRVVGESTVSTGKAGFSTPPGHYSVVWKDKEHISTRFGDYVDDFGAVVKSNVDSAKDRRPPGSHFDGARMPYAMFFRGGYAMHQGYVPPYAASHGCIRLPREMADIFFDNAPLGTPVVVKEAPVKSVSASREQFDRSPPALPVYAPVPSPAPNLVRSTAPASVRPASVRSTVPAPTPVLSRAPVPAPVPVRSPSPAPVRSLAPTAVRPTPTPVPSRKHRRVHSRAPVRPPQTSPTPTR